MAEQSRIARGLANLKSAFRFSGYGGSTTAMSGYGGFWDWVTGLLPGSRYDYRREAGTLWENSIVFACLMFIIDTYLELPLIVTRPDAKGKPIPVPNHPLAQLMQRPNPDYDGMVLASGLLISLYVDGNAYLYKDRSAAGKTVGLYYVPHFQLEPRWDINGSDFIGWYEYLVDGNSFRLETGDIIHIRNGVDPANLRKGLSRLNSVLREICTDNEAATLAAALLRNMGVPGVIIKPPKRTRDDDPTVVLNRTTREKLRDLWTENFGGEGYAKPFVFSEAVDIESFAFSPKELVMDKIRTVPEERISACFGIPAMVVGLGAGLQRSTFSNYSQAIKVAYHRSLVPTGKRISAAITHAFQDEPAYDLSGGATLAYDYSGVTELQPDVQAVHDQAIEDFQGGLLMLNEARAEIGKEPVADGDGHVWDYDPVVHADPTPTEDAQASKAHRRSRRPREKKEIAS